MHPTAESIHDATATFRDEDTLMATFGITQEPGPYVYGGHRYDKLTDAVHYAQRHQSSKNIMRVSRDLEAQQCCDACALQNPGSFIASRCITVDGLLVMRHRHLACALVSQREVGTTPSGSNGVLQHRPVAAWNYGHVGWERAGDARRSRSPATACENAADL